MPSYLPGYLIKETRKRRKWLQSMITTTENYEKANLSRIENALQNPNKKTLLKLMNTLGMPVNTFFSPYLENQPINIFEKRDEILYLLNTKSPEKYEEAKQLIRKMEQREGFESGINLQFILSCKAQLNELKQQDPADTLLFVNKGMAITYGGFDENTFEGDILKFEEANLLHMMAFAYHRIGKKAGAIKLLRLIQEGLMRLPEDALEKERKLAPILLTLVDFLIKDKCYLEAFNLCKLGNSISIKCSKGKYTPEFLFKMAICVHKLGNLADCRKYLQQSYFGYALLNKKEQAKQVLDYAQKPLDTPFNTYSVENLFYEEQVFFMNHVEIKPCSGVGELIAALRHEAELSQQELCRGICSQANFNKIENGKIQANVYYLEAFMQRLGRDINKYFNTFPSVEDFYAKQIRDEINTCIANLNYKTASELLDELKLMKSYRRKGIGKQFILETEATIFGNCEGYDKPEYLNRLKNALEITIPNFDESKTDRYRLTYTEITIINQIAIHYCEAGDIPRGVKLFERLIENINNYYVDEIEKVRAYTNILYNYSKYLGLIKRYDEALRIIDEGEMLAMKHGQLTLLPSFAVNRACNLLDLGKKEESVPYFAIAFYGAIILDEKNNYLAVSAYVKERLGIDFDYLGLGS